MIKEVTRNPPHAAERSNKPVETKTPPKMSKNNRVNLQSIMGTFLEKLDIIIQIINL